MGNLKSATLVLVILFLIPSVTLQQTNVKAQASNISAPATEWQQEYGDSNIEIDRISNVVQTSDGGYAFLSLGWNHQMSTLPPILFKVDSLGNEQWQKTIHSFGAYSFATTRDNGFAVLGIWNWDPNSNAPKVHTLIKLDSGGNMQWSRNLTIQNPYMSIPISVIQADDGGFALLYQISNYQEGYDLSWASIIRTDSTGDLLWQEPYYSNATHIELQGLIQTKDRGYAIFGSTSFNGTTDTPNSYYWLTKTDTRGKLDWSRFYGNGPSELETNQTRNEGAAQKVNRYTFGDNEGISVVETFDGGFVFGGIVYSETQSVWWNNAAKTFLIKTNNLGNALWNQTIDSLEISPIVETSDNGLVVSVINGIVKTDANGNELWIKNDVTISSLGSEPQRLGISSLIETSDGALALLGAGSIGSNIWDGNIYLTKTKTFLPLPSPTQSPIPIQTPIISFNEPFLIFVLVITVFIIAMIVSIFFYRKNRKTAISFQKAYY
jgi:hypothetical protein